MATVYLTKRAGQLQYRYSKSWPWNPLPVKTLAEAEQFFVDGKDRINTSGKCPRPEIIFTTPEGEAMTHFQITRLTDGSISVEQNVNNRESDYFNREFIWSDYERLSWLTAHSVNLPDRYTGSALAAVNWIKENEPATYQAYITEERERQEAVVNHHAEIIAAYYNTRPVIE